MKVVGYRLWKKFNFQPESRLNPITQFGIFHGRIREIFFEWELPQQFGLH